MSSPQRLYTGEIVRVGEALAAEKAGVDMYSLMKLAGHSVFDVLRETYPQVETVTIVCGTGNNGGDGFVVSKLAKQAGLTVNVVLVGEPAKVQGDAKKAMNEWLDIGGNVLSTQDLADALTDTDVVIDGMLGTGLVGQVRSDVAVIIERINRGTQPVVAIDIPSGLCSDTGDFLGRVVQADHTITFIALKQGLVTGKARAVVGELHFAGLGIDDVFSSLYPSHISVLEDTQMRNLAPVREALAHKGRHGRLLCLGGNSGYAGAIRLCAQAGARSGAGLVSAMCHSSSSLALQVACPEVMTSVWEGDDQSLLQVMADNDVIACGPGLGRDKWARSILRLITSTEGVKVLDADGLNLLAEQPNRDANRVITPHPGEAAKLLGCSINQIEQNRYVAVRMLQQRYGGVVVLKGVGSLVCHGDNIAVCTAGNPGMASGGMGDVLTGVIAALIAQGLSCYDAACLGVYVHSVAADQAARKSGQIGMAASDLIPEIRALLNRFSLCNKSS